VTPTSARRCTAVIAIIGESGAGVTTLARALSLHHPESVWLDTSASSGLAVGACLTASDGVIIAVSAVQGMSADVATTWERVAHLPTMVVVTHLDAPRADIDETAAVCRRVLGLDLQIPYLPIHDDDGTLAGFLDVLGDVIHVQEIDGALDLPTDDEHRAFTQAYRDELIDLLLAESADDATVAAMTAGSHVPQVQVTAWLHQGIASARIHVALGFASDTSRGDIGLDLIAELMSATTPSLEVHQPPVLTLPNGDPTEALRIEGPAVALVLGCDAVGTCCRVLAGWIAEGDPLVAVSCTEGTPVLSPISAQWSDAATATAGDVVHTQLDLRAGTTLASPEHIVLVESG
jgi:translation elongation factor EF-G